MAKHMRKDMVFHFILTIGLILVLISYIVLFPLMHENQRINLSEYTIYNYMLSGYLLMFIYHIYILTFIYELTQMGLETLFQIISALVVVFSMMLFIPKLIIFNSLDAYSQTFDLKSSWTILIILFIIQTLILLFNMIYIIKKRQVI